mmetsp:Transcript_92511/g.299066  ORF Transcript_92511/g.299066 Transcript_92511/m.299066 type:complete len:660 (-) Transcript_92511:473-2452(-)|eukprot:CAMPEP_0204250540 /NCGR_PEP_ID=MMETSP0361-20130328/100217_1 /ASSEMBLY_ACC=CAM_ASM_000343 /TAXON_ID=268821 /ORGANISM="Scrippsiella Hangoei, Strain SHTV-5" /LENGTH=659 /DNA_ID=CAMNT_0051223809 /DNA_START=50 /DNA_END=2029 /DNA_ORIENTATION=+
MGAGASAAVGMECPPESVDKESLPKPAVAIVVSGEAVGGGGEREEHDCGIEREKRARLRDMKVFVLDNSLREPSVGATFGHTVDDKEQIMECVKEVGFREIVVGAPNKHSQVDDLYCHRLQSRGTDVTHLWTFSEYADERPVPYPRSSEEQVPIGLRKTRDFGFRNTVIELDAGDPGIDWGDGAGATANADGAMTRYVDGLVWLLNWMRANLGASSRSMINIRDLSLAMVKKPARVMRLVAAIARIPSELCPIALLFEEPLGEYLPSEVGGWTRRIRKAMDTNGWPSTFQRTGDEATADGVLLIHVHRMWGMADAVNIEALAAGADGVFAGVCEEGAAMGHACTAVALANLARLGNTDVVQRFHLSKIAEAARLVTRLTTHQPVNQRQIVYGSRAVEAVFGFTGIGGGLREEGFDLDGDGDANGVVDRFQLSALFGVKDPPIRLHILATPSQFCARLVQCFGEAEADAHGFRAEELGKALQKQVHKNQCEGNDDEYTSAVGLAQLYREATGGGLTPAMMAALAAAPEKTATERTAALLEGVERFFSQAVVDQERDQAEGGLAYTAFYATFVAPYFDSHNTFAAMGGRTADRAEIDRLVDAFFDLNHDRCVQWSEWRRWCVFALREHGDEISDVDELTRVVLRNTILPSFLSQGRVHDKP